MGTTHDELGDEHRDWIAEQRVFFVATAPLSATGHVNLSPKGYDTFRVIDAHTVAYLDLTGSGVETIAHLRDNGRITLMFCGFEGRPRILRIYGRGFAIRPDDDGFAALMDRFDPIPGLRSIIRLEIEFVQSSCGYSVPLMTYDGERETLKSWAEAKGEDRLETYWADRNATSLDGLVGLA